MTVSDVRGKHLDATRGRGRSSRCTITLDRERHSSKPLLRNCCTEDVPDGGIFLTNPNTRRTEH